MKIHAFHRLPRRDVPLSSFGYGTLAEIAWPPLTTFYTAPALYRCSLGDYVEFGMGISSERPTGFNPELFKSVEYADINLRGRRTPCVAERFWMKDGSDFMPYRIRYRYAGYNGYEDALYASNLERLHRDLTGAPVILQDPIIGFVDDAIGYQHPDIYQLHRLWEEANNHIAPSHFIHAELSGNIIEERVRDTIFTTDTRPLRARLPFIPREDVLAREGCSDSLKPRDIERRAVNDPLTLPFKDVEHLDVDDPSMDVLETPMAFASVASALDALIITDLDLEYILLDGKLSECIVHAAFDRYAHIVPSLTNKRDECDRIARIAFGCFFAYRRNHEPGESVFSNSAGIALRITRTYNDEALLVFRPLTQTQKPGKGGLAVHIDLAMLGLCAPGASIS